MAQASLGAYRCGIKNAPGRLSDRTPVSYRRTMATKVYSTMKAPNHKPKYRLLGVDQRGVHHIVREPEPEIIGVHPDRGLVARETPPNVAAWTESVRATIGWDPDADAVPGEGLLEGADG
jgi:hypothetical protein